MSFLAKIVIFLNAGPGTSLVRTLTSSREIARVGTPLQGLPSKMKEKIMIGEK